VHVCRTVRNDARHAPWGGFTYVTREKVVDIGPIHASREETDNVPITPIAGVIGGIVLLAVGCKE
jgi:hypothetical protein